MKYTDPVYALTEMSVAELRSVAEREAEREIKSEEDYERAVKASEMLVELWDMEQEEIDYGYGINTGAARPSDLITFIDHRKALEELRNRNKPAPELVRQQDPPKARARRLGIRDVVRLQRLDRIEGTYIPEGMTQAEMAEAEVLEERTIRKDIALMKRHSQEFPLTAQTFRR